MTPRVLFLQFEADAGPGRLAVELEGLGACVEVACLHLTPALPDLDCYQAVVPLGGSMNAEEDGRFPFLAPTVALLQDAIRRDLPVLGVCLGGQLLARALGARIWRKKQKEIGYFPIQVTPAGSADPLFAGLPAEILTFQWHEDAFELPAGAALLADSQRDTAQVFRYGQSYGLQFHPEVTGEGVGSWCGWESAALSAAARPTSREALLRSADEVEDLFAAQTHVLCANWLACVDTASRQRR